MTADEIIAQYREVCLQTVYIRRYSGANAARTKTDFACMGNARLYGADELMGQITEGDEKVIALAEDLEEAGFVFPLKTSDKIVAGGRELSVVNAGERRALDGTLIAYEVQARG